MVRITIERRHNNRVAACIAALCTLLNSFLARAPGQLQIKGDPELLNLVARTHEQNKERISTWQGTARITEHVNYGEAHPLAADKIVELWNRFSASFAYDRVRQSTRWTWNYEESGHKASNGAVTTQPGGECAGMLKGNIFYNYGDGHSNVSKQLSIHQLKDTYRYSIFSFKPMDYLELVFRNNAGTIQDLLITAYYKPSKDPNWQKNDEVVFKPAITRNGDHVIFELTWAGKAFNRYDFDLARGANLISYAGLDDTAKHEVIWTYRKQKDAWIPTKVTQELTNWDPGFLRLRSRSVKTVEFTKQTVNEPIDPSEFSLDNLGVQHGGRVNDYRDPNAPVVYEYDPAMPETRPAHVRPILTRRPTSQPSSLHDGDK